MFLSFSDKSTFSVFTYYLQQQLKLDQLTLARTSEMQTPFSFSQIPRQKLISQNSPKTVFDLQILI